MYTINFNTGAGNLTAETIEEAMIKADENACYTQKNITITDENGKTIATRYWYGTKYDKNEPEENPIIFGDFGFYGDWIEA